MFWATVCPSSGETTVLCNSWYMLFCVDDLLVCRVIPESHPHRVTGTKCCKNTVVSPDDRQIVAKLVEIYKFTKNKLCIMLVLFTSLLGVLCKNALSKWETCYQSTCVSLPSETQCTNLSTKLDMLRSPRFNCSVNITRSYLSSHFTGFIGYCVAYTLQMFRSCVVITWSVFQVTINNIF